MAGGYNPDYIDSTETLTIGDNSWETAASLPYAVYGIIGVSIRNKVFFTGEYEYMQKVEHEFD